MTTEILKPKNEIKLRIREEIMSLERSISEQEDAFFGDSDICPLKHSFCDGVYVREIFIPRGIILTGKIHKHEHPNFLMSGTVEVITESGGKETLTGPVAMISPSGTKRALHAVTDLVWITVHHNPTNTQDLNELEKIVIADSFDEYERFKTSKRTLMNKFVSFIDKIKKTIL